MTDEEMKRLEELAKAAEKYDARSEGSFRAKSMMWGMLGPTAVLALIERVRRAESPPVALAGGDAIRLTATGGLAPYAATKRPDVGIQSLRFEPPMDGDAAERSLSALCPIPDDATVFVVGSPPEAGLDRAPLRYDYLPAAARLKVRTQRGRRTLGVRHVIDWEDYRVTREDGHP